MSDCSGENKVHNVRVIAEHLNYNSIGVMLGKLTEIAPSFAESLLCKPCLDCGDKILASTRAPMEWQRGMAG